jgi:lipoprotein-releasing system ATP-binding protein
MINFVPTIEIEDVSHSYFLKECGIVVLKNINFTVGKGEIVSIMGMSGSGKSTLLAIAGLLLTPTCGSVKIEGTKVTDFSEEKKSRFRLENIGFIYQKHFLLSDFNAEENVMMPLIMQKKLNYVESKKRAKDLLTRFNIKERFLHLPSQLSGGECQRVAIARAVASLPKLILADEPTGNLDSSNAKTAFLCIKNIVKENDLSCIIATHDHELLGQVDRVFLLENGMLKAL